MCLEASQKLGINDVDYEIDDILSGILILGNLYKRVGNEKVSLEATIEQLKKDATDLAAETTYMVSVNYFIFL